MSASRGQLRIIAGSWRSRKLDFPEHDTLRPTPDRVRETLFNWLQADVAGSRCLDLFAGSGSLGFEAASRGAGEVIMIEHDRSVCAALEANRELLGADNIQIKNSYDWHIIPCVGYKVYTLPALQIFPVNIPSYQG